MAVNEVHNDKGLDLKAAMALLDSLESKGVAARIVNYGVRPSGNPRKDRRLAARNYFVVS